MSKMNNNKLVKWALRYRNDFGFNVIPISYRTKIPPKGLKWTKYEKTPATEERIREWFGNEKQRNIGVIMGVASGGLTVLDFDSPEAYEWWREKYPEIAKSVPTSRTGCGHHIWFRSDLQKTRHYTSMDLKATGYVLLPPSRHKNGNQYEWINPLPENGKLPEFDLLNWELERFTEDIEDIEDKEDTDRHRSHKGKGDLVVSYDDFLRSLPPSDGRGDILEKAMSKTLPKGVRQRNDAIWPFCQWLKAIPEFRDERAAVLKPVIREWHKRAYPKIGTKSFDRTWGDFVHAWKRVKWPKGDVVLEQAVKKALDAEADLPEVDDYDSAEAKYLLRICYELQQGVGDQPFFLASRTGAGIIGVSHETVLKYMEAFVEDGILEVVEKYTKSKAARYRYIAHKNNVEE